MKYVGGNPYFLSTNDKKQIYTALNKDICCDVLIVGGGVTGALCSYFFRNNNVDTVLIEADLIGQSSTSICTSILEYEIDVDLVDLKKFIGEAEATTAFKLGKDAVYKIKDIIDRYSIDCDFRLTPCLYYTNDINNFSKFKDEYLARKEAGFDVSFLDTSNRIDYVPFELKAGILTKNASATFQPYKFTKNLISNLCDEGLKVFEMTKLTNTENIDDKIICNTSTGFKITTKKIIICTGYSAANMLKENIASFTRTFNIVTSPIDSTTNLWYKNCTIIDDSTPYYYMRLTPDNRVILGGEDITDLDLNDDKINNSYNNLQGKLKVLLPHIKNYNIDYKYNGIFADSKQSIPYIGEHEDYPNHYFCLGYGSNGVLYSTFGAEMLAKLYLGDYDPNLNIFKFNRD